MGYYQLQFLQLFVGESDRFGSTSLTEFSPDLTLPDAVITSLIVEPDSALFYE